MKKPNYEDFIMKRAMDIFAEEGKKDKAIEIAKKAILKGMDNDTIKDLTDLSIDEIEAIRHVI